MKLTAIKPISRYLLLTLCCLGCFRSVKAQPDNAYILKLTGAIDTSWLVSIGSAISAQSLDWIEKKAPGFTRFSPAFRRRALLSQTWSFYKVNGEKVLQDAQNVKLSHNFEANRNYNAGWYLTNISLNKTRDKKYVLLLNRIELFSAIYINGKLIDRHFGSYTPFEMDITTALKTGENQLAIFVYDQSAAVDGDRVYNQVATTYLSNYTRAKGMMNLPGGIHDVPVLKVREKNYVDDVFVKTSTRKKELEIEYKIAGENISLPGTKLSFEIYKWPNGEKVDVNIPSVSPLNSSEIQSIKIKWAQPDLWSPDHPNLYVLRTILKQGRTEDVTDTRFGFREFWIKGKSFMLNGFPIRLRGESHYRPMHDGVAFHREVFKMNKELFGVNAFRIHATMPPNNIMLAADEAGILLIDQSAIWSVNGNFYLKGGDLFLKNVKEEFAEWIKRDRNNPSVVIWDLENEMLRFNAETHLPWISKLPAFVKNMIQHVL